MFKGDVSKFAWIAAIFPYSFLYFYIEKNVYRRGEKTKRFLEGLPLVVIAAAALVLFLTFTLEGSSRSAELFIENIRAITAFHYERILLAF